MGQIKHTHTHNTNNITSHSSFVTQYDIEILKQTLLS